MTFYFPEAVRKIIKDDKYILDQTGMSASQVFCFTDVVLKVTKQSASSDREHQMLMWLQDRLPVPEVILSLQENGINYLLMKKMTGKMACDDFYMEQPELLTELLAEGLKRLWQVDIANCPQSDLLEKRLQEAGERVRLGICDTADAEPDTYNENGFASPEALYEWLLKHRPKIEHPVFCHGDYCLPNIFFSGNQFSGFIDIGDSGVCDMYQDIALCYRSLIHNFDGRYGYQGTKHFNPNMLFEKLGITPNWNKIRYFILLDELF